MVHLSGRHHKIRTAEGTNQTSPFHLGLVGHILRTVRTTVQIKTKHDVVSSYLIVKADTL